MMANVQIVGLSTTEFYLNQIKFTGRCTCSCPLVLPKFYNEESSDNGYANHKFI